MPKSNGQLKVATELAVINWEFRQTLMFKLQIGEDEVVVLGALVVV